MSDWSTLATSLIGGGAAGLMVQLSGLRRESRSIRSEFLRPLAVVEMARWAGREYDWAAFRKAAHELQAAAIVCGVPQYITETYLAYCLVFRRVSQDALDAAEDDSDYLVGSTFSKPVNDMAALASDAAWRPLRTRVSAKRRIQQINQAFDIEVGKPTSTDFTPWRRHFADDS